MTTTTSPIFTDGVLSLIRTSDVAAAVAAGSILGFEYCDDRLTDVDLYLPIMFTDAELRGKIAEEGGPIEAETATSAELAIALLRAQGLTAYDRVEVLSLNDVDGDVAGGTAVTITGVGFVNKRGGDPTVTFGGAAATSVVVVNNTTITCVSPAHDAGAVGVGVANLNGDHTLATAFTYS